MFIPLLICALTCITMILCVLFKPQFRLGKICVSSYWVVALVGACVMIISGYADPMEIGKALIADSAINPIKILVLFISMTVLSVFLDEINFFKYLAGKTLSYAGTSQLRLFVILYITVSVLTVFTSNDIIVLTFTPFICYFAKNAKIDPLPYLIAVFVAANTWSMALVIGNPTNIYLSTFNGIDFLAYAKRMLLPTVAAGIAAFLLILAVFHKKLADPIRVNQSTIHISDKPLLIIGLIHLAVCTVALAVGSYIGVEMWLISLLAVVSLFVCNAVIGIRRKRAPYELIGCLKRAPWSLIPFVLSMFVLILAASKCGITEKLNELLGHSDTVLRYGVASFLSANLINNIPMSVLFCSVIESLEGGELTRAVYAVVVGSNIGAFLTPIGALAGVMWSSILREQNIKFGYIDFLKYGALISIPTMAAALVALMIVV